MARGKTPTGLIDNEKRRRTSFKNRRRGLLDKAGQLAALCGVPVAVVCADPRGGVPPTVLETEEGVLARYRALPAERRAGHGHRGYLEGLLVKERAKLARVRQGGPDALATPHAELGRMTRDELRALLGAVDAALAAAAERRRALGLPPPGDDGSAVVETCGDSGAWTGGSSSSSDDGAGYGYYPMQQQQQQGPGDAHVDGLELTMWGAVQVQPHGAMDVMQPDRCYDDAMNAMQQPAYNPRHDDALLDQAMTMVPRDYYCYDDMNTTYNQQCNIGDMGGYQLPMMPGNGGGSYHGHGGFQHYDGNNSYAGAMPNLTMWWPDAMPAEYPGRNSNFPGALPEFLGMGGAGGNGMTYYAGGNDMQGSSNDLRYSGGSSIDDLLFGDDSDN